MNNISKLPHALKQEANNLIDEKLSEKRGYEWALEYHRKLVLTIQRDKNKGDFYEEYEGDICYNMRMLLNLKIEQALRALIDRIKELEASK